MFSHFDHIKVAGDFASAFIVLGTLAQYLPQIAAGLSICWTLYRFGDSLYGKWKRSQKPPA